MINKDINELLFEAALEGRAEDVAYYLSLGADINSRHNLNATALYAAARNNYSDIVKLLTDNNADVELSINSGATPLYVAIYDCYGDVIKNLIDANANVESVVYGLTPLYVAIKVECVEAVKELLNAGAKVYWDEEEVQYHVISTPLSLNSFLYNKEENKNNQAIQEIYPLVLNYYWKGIENQVKEIEERTKNSTKTFQVVIVRYNEDVSWALKEFPNEKVIIFNKGPDDLIDLPDNFEVIKIPNVGYLGGTYLKYIIDYYYNLADITLFIQGHPYDVNVHLPLIRHKESLDSSCKNIKAKCVESTLAKEWEFLKDTDWDAHIRYKDFAPRNLSMIDYAHKYIGNIPLDEPLQITFGAIFAVLKEKILSCDIEHYQAMWPIFNYIKPMADHFQERLWDSMFEYCSRIRENIKNKGEYMEKTLNYIVSQEKKVFLSNNKAIFALPNNLVFIIDTRDSFQKIHNLTLGEGHEPYMIKNMLALINPDDTYIEIGANYGDFALQVSKKVGVNGKVYAFEPGKNLFECFSASIFLNGVENIKLENLAVIDKEQEVNFYEDVRGSLGSSIAENNKGNQLIKAISLDSYFKGKEQTINFIRLDAEGSECKVLEGAKNIIASSEDVILSIEWQMPLLSKYHSLDAINLCLTNLSDKGFILVDILEVKEGCSYLNYQISAEDILDSNVVELLAIKPKTLKKFGKDYNTIDLSECAYVQHYLNGRLLIHYAMYGEIIKAKEIIAKGVDVNFFESGVNALYMSAQNGHSEIVKVLLQAGASTDNDFVTGMSPLYVSVTNNDSEIVKLLLDYNADTEVSLSTGSTPLFAASYFGYDDILKLLIEHGANKNVQVQGVNMISAALQNDHPSTAIILAGSQDKFCQLIQHSEYETKYAELCGESKLEL